MDRDVLLFYQYIVIGIRYEFDFNASVSVFFSPLFFRKQIEMRTLTRSGQTPNHAMKPRELGENRMERENV